MNKPEFIAAVSDKAGLSRKDTERVINAALDTITVALTKGEKVAFSGFGIFESKLRKARISVNGRVVKASYDVKVGDRLEIALGNRTLAVEVLQVAETVKKDDACAMYKEV